MIQSDLKDFVFVLKGLSIAQWLPSRRVEKTDLRDKAGVNENEGLNTESDVDERLNTVSE